MTKDRTRQRAYSVPTMENLHPNANEEVFTKT